jgi:hypothetical protein
MKAVDVDALQSQASFELAVIILFPAIGKDESVLIGVLLLNLRRSCADRIVEDFVLSSYYHSHYFRPCHQASVVQLRVLNQATASHHRPGLRLNFVLSRFGLHGEDQQS